MQEVRISSFSDRDEGLAVKLPEQGWMGPELAIRNHRADLLQNRAQAPSINPTAESGSRAHYIENAVWVESGKRQHANGYPDLMTLHVSAQAKYCSSSL